MFPGPVASVPLGISGLGFRTPRLSFCAWSPCVGTVHSPSTLALWCGTVGVAPLQGSRELRDGSQMLEPLLTRSNGYSVHECIGPGKFSQEPLSFLKKSEVLNDDAGRHLGSS